MASNQHAEVYEQQANKEGRVGLKPGHESRLLWGHVSGVSAIEGYRVSRSAADLRLRELFEHLDLGSETISRGPVQQPASAAQPHIRSRNNHFGRSVLHVNPRTAVVAWSSSATPAPMQGHIELPGAIPGQVVTRFPPEPSWLLDVGHVKAVLVNEHLASSYQVCWRHALHASILQQGTFTACQCAYQQHHTAI
jgi:hypothetical protein